MNSWLGEHDGSEYETSSEHNASIAAVPDSTNSNTTTRARAACGPDLAKVPDEGAHLLVRHAGRVPVEPPGKYGTSADGVLSRGWYS